MDQDGEEEDQDGKEEDQDGEEERREERKEERKGDEEGKGECWKRRGKSCLLYTSDAADER